MTEDDTFNALVKLSFRDMDDLITKSAPLSSYDVEMLCKKHGWKYIEYIDAIHEYFNKYDDNK